MGNEPTIRSLPLAFGLAMAWFFERTMSAPPLTPDMMRILDHDDAIDAAPAARALGLELTALDEMLRRCIATRLDQDRT